MFLLYFTINLNISQKYSYDFIKNRPSTLNLLKNKYNSNIFQTIRIINCGSKIIFLRRSEFYYIIFLQEHKNAVENKNSKEIYTYKIVTKLKILGLLSPSG